MVQFVTMSEFVFIVSSRGTTCFGFIFVTWRGVQGNGGGVRMLLILGSMSVDFLVQDIEGGGGGIRSNNTGEIWLSLGAVWGTFGRARLWGSRDVGISH